MGLDMYVEVVKDKNFKGAVAAPDNANENQEFHYWRKHPNLHGWMEKLYRSKGGNKDLFNCEYVELTKKDIEQLFKDIMKNKLPYTQGFFFGQDPSKEDLRDYVDQLIEDLEFISKALAFFEEEEEHPEKEHLVYTSWW